MSQKKDVAKNIKKEDLDISTQLSIQRTILANTRTFGAWVRTGLSSVLGGFAIAKFLGQSNDHETLVSAIGILFIAIGIGIFIFAYFHYKKSHEKLNETRNDLSPPSRMLLIMSLGLVVVSLFISVLLVLFK